MLSRHDLRLHSKFDNLDSDYHMALQMVQCMLCLWHDLQINQMSIENAISFKKEIYGNSALFTEIGYSSQKSTYLNLSDRRTLQIHRNVCVQRIVR